MLADVRDRIDENNKAMVPDEIPFEAEDGALVTAAKSGSIGAFEVLVKRHQGRILRVARRVTRNREDAEDIVQQSLQKAFGHLHTFEERSSFSTWLTRIAINEGIMCLRRRRAKAVWVDALTPSKEAALTLQIPDPSASPERSCAQRETERFLFSAINQLTPGVLSQRERPHDGTVGDGCEVSSVAWPPGVAQDAQALGDARGPIWM